MLTKMNTALNSTVYRVVKHHLQNLVECQVDQFDAVNAATAQYIAHIECNVNQLEWEIWYHIK